MDVVLKDVIRIYAKEGSPMSQMRPGKCSVLFPRGSRNRITIHFKDDCLKIRCRIGVLISEIPDGADFRDLYQRLYAHKGFLAARVPAFSRLIRLDWYKSQEFVIKNMKFRIFKGSFQEIGNLWGRC